MQMSGSCILDSNIVIDIFRNNAETIAKVRQLSGIYVPTIVLGELYYGAYKSNQTDRRILEIKQLEERVNLLRITEKTAEHYGEIKSSLRKRGKPIPENDVWIAAVAKEKGLPLLTRDKHFEEVEGISLLPI